MPSCERYICARFNGTGGTLLPISDPDLTLSTAGIVFSKFSADIVFDFKTGPVVSDFKNIVLGLGFGTGLDSPFESFCFGLRAGMGTEAGTGREAATYPSGGSDLGLSFVCSLLALPLCSSTSFNLFSCFALISNALRDCVPCCDKFSPIASSYLVVAMELDSVDLRFMGNFGGSCSSSEILSNAGAD